MIKIINLEVRQFQDCNKELQDKIIERYAKTNVDYEWWDSIYDDAKTIGLEITGFDIDRGNYCKGDFKQNIQVVAQNIINKHGNTCDTYKNGINFLQEVKIIENRIREIDKFPEDIGYLREEELEELESNYKYNLLEDYKSLLKHEYEYLTSKESIINTLTVDEYYFDDNGKIWSI